MTNLEGRVHPAPPARRDRRPGCAPTCRSSPALAERLGRGQYFSRPMPEAVFDELRRASAGGIADYCRHHLRADRGGAGRLLALPDRGARRARRACSPTASPTPDGRARFHAGRAPRRPPSSRTRTIPLYLTTGRVLSQYQSGTQTRRVAALTTAEPEPIVEIHPETGPQRSASGR